MVASVLGPDRKPALGPSPDVNQTAFATWFKTDTAEVDSTLRNYQVCRNFPMSKTTAGGWGYDSYAEPSHSFFPIDNFNAFGETFASKYVDSKGVYHADPNGKLHNFHFCLDLHRQ